MTDIVERDMSLFFQAPFNAYGPQSVYVSPMLSDLQRFLTAGLNPLFATNDDFTYFAAVKDGKPIGRITAHVHRGSNTLHKTNRAYFGYFDCANDPDAAGLLLGAAEAWARQRGFDTLIGNFNLTAMQQAGVMTAGFEHAPFTDQIWGAPWLPELLVANGYTQSFPMTTFQLDLTRVDPARLLLAEQRKALLDAGFTFEPVTRRTLAARLEDSRTILNTSFRDNPMFVPITQQEYAFQAKEMKWVMDPRISTVVHKDGQPAGAIIAIPDLNPLVRATGAKVGLMTPWHYLKYRMTRRRAVIIFQGVLPQFQGMGLNPMMLAHVAGQMQKAGYETVGGTWVADVNKASLRQAEKSGAAPLHKLHLYSKVL